MNPRELVSAALRGDDLLVRQLVKDAARAGFSWSSAPAPELAGLTERAVYAGLVEMLASRAGEPPPSWTSSVGNAAAPVYLVSAATTSRALRRESESGTPKPLRKRHVYALPGYLDVL